MAVPYYVKYLPRTEFTRLYSLCCPPRKPPPGCGCPPNTPSCGIPCPPKSCRQTVIPPNPCVPRYVHGKDTWKKYKYISFLMLGLIAIQTYIVSGHHPPKKGECRDYEYMRLRFKKYPWRDGVKTLFHNDETNHLPGECTPPPLDCD